MKQVFIILSFIFLYAESFGQPKNQVTLIYGSAGNELKIPDGWLGDIGYSGKGSNSYGLRYSRKIYKFFSIETGLEYSVNKIEVSSFPDGQTHTNKLRINLLSIPLYGNITFLKYFFVNAGPIFDFQTNDKDLHSTSDQTGIGLGFGIGAKYSLNNFTISINPFYQKHYVMPYKKENYHENLSESGIKLGLGYNF